MYKDVPMNLVLAFIVAILVLVLSISMMDSAPKTAGAGFCGSIIFLAICILGLFAEISNR